jgi:hypothetical protein
MANATVNRVVKHSPAKQNILNYLRRQGRKGATCYEVEVECNLLHQSASPALLDLQDNGYIGYALDKYDMPKQRPTQTGRPAYVYVLQAHRTTFVTGTKVST